MEQLVTFVVTCQGRDHTVNIHLEPDLALRNLRERPRLITPHWPLYSEALGVITEDDFSICEPEEGRFNVWNQTFTDGDTGKAAIFHSFSSRSRNCPASLYEGDSSVNGVLRTLSRIDRAPITLPMAEARDFQWYSCVFENFGGRSIPSDHANVRDHDQ